MFSRPVCSAHLLLIDRRMREKYVRKLHVMLWNLIQLISILDSLEDKQILLLFNTRVLIPRLANRAVL